MSKNEILKNEKTAEEQIQDIIRDSKRSPGAKIHDWISVMVEANKGELITRG